MAAYTAATCPGCCRLWAGEGEEGNTGRAPFSLSLKARSKGLSWGSFSLHPGAVSGFMSPLSPDWRPGSKTPGNSGSGCLLGDPLSFQSPQKFDAFVQSSGLYSAREKKESAPTPS